MGENTEKDQKIDLDFAVYDNTIAILFLFFLFILFLAFPPKIFSIMIESLGGSLSFILSVILIILPIIIVILIEILLHIHEKRKGDKSEFSIKSISFTAFYAIPLFFLVYFPTTIIECIFWIITIVGIYIGFGKEHFPLVKYGIHMPQLERTKDITNENNAINILTSIHSLNLCTWIILVIITFNVYPVPFLLIFYIKYYFKKKYFSDSSVKLYKKWKLFEESIMKFLYIFVFILVIVLAVQFGVVIGLNN